LSVDYAIVKDISADVLSTLFEGGAGSGNWGHKGRPGKRGGSLPTKGKSIARAILKGERGSIRIPKVSGKLWRAARTMRNIEVAASGSPMKMLKRLANIFVGRKFVSKIYR
jgi:hypothetical protein